MKPPSPAMGSITIAATLSAPISLSMRLIASAAAFAPSRPSWNGYDSGTR